MSIEEKQNSLTSQDSDSIKYPQNEKEAASFIKKFYKSNIPVELIGAGSKRKIGSPPVSYTHLTLPTILLV